MKKWRFISNQNSTIYGINDAGIVEFTADMNRSLVREIIQNSLDAIIPSSEEPVTVEFNLFEVDKNSLPDVCNFTDAIVNCKASNKNEPDAYRFFDKAERILAAPTIKILRISDHNTVGLEGSDTCEKGTNWSRLVKESGSSNKGQSSGGSFGIGKAAAFACSDLRTVFYSSLDKDGLKSNFGVARLISFEDKDIGWTTGTGYYSDNELFTAINELASFDESYNRRDSGTDIYIIGMHDTENFKDAFIKCVLLDFLVSLVKGKLVVKVQDETISKDTLVKYISKLNQYEAEDIKDLIEYYHLLTSTDPRILKIPLDSNKYGKKYGFNNDECTLYLKEAEGLNRKVLLTRKAGMRIFDLDRISGSIEFTGVLVMDGDNMNKAFKRMEVPSHDAWEPGICRDDKKYYEKILSEFKKYIRDTVKESFCKITSSNIDAYGASDFLPDEGDNDKNKEKFKEGITSRLKTIKGKDVIPSKKKTKNPDIDKKIEKEAGGSGPGDSQKEGNGVGIRPGEGDGFAPGNQKGPKSSNQSGSNIRYSKIETKKRLICTDSASGKYNLSLTIPSKHRTFKLVFSIAGEQSDVDLPIKGAKVINSGSIQIDKIDTNEIYLSGSKMGDVLKLEVNVDFNKYCMMEVDYYAQ